jgi:hypothetical protein
MLAVASLAPVLHMYSVSVYLISFVHCSLDYFCSQLSLAVLYLLTW